VGFVVELSVMKEADGDSTICCAHRSRPTTPIIACATGDEDAARLFVRAVQAGANHVALYGVDDLQRVVVEALGPSLKLPVCAEAAHQALPWIPPLAHPVITYCTMNAQRRPTVSVTAEALRVSERSLYRLLHDLALPTPEATIGWCRLFVATQMTAIGEPINHVAATLGFGSGSAFRDSLRRYAGLTPAAIRDSGIVVRLARSYCAARRRQSGAILT
jgi:AraC-like DNA-binding protein